MTVGNTRPELREDWRAKHWFWRRLAECEWLASWFFHLFNTVALFRLAIESAAAVALIITVMGVLGEFEQRETDRSVRVATLFTQIAQTLALPDERGLTAVKVSVEMLVQERASMKGINLRKADLSGGGPDRGEPVRRGPVRGGPD